VADGLDDAGKHGRHLLGRDDQRVSLAHEGEHFRG
jgi:hypothetical protein